MLLAQRRQPLRFGAGAGKAPFRHILRELDFGTSRLLIDRLHIALQRRSESRFLAHVLQIFDQLREEILLILFFALLENRRLLFRKRSFSSLRKAGLTAT